MELVPVAVAQLEPAVAEQVQVAPVSDAGRVSTTLAPMLADGPLLVTTTVYVVVAEGTIVVEPLVFVTTRSAARTMASTSVAVLLVVFGSFCSATTCAALVRVPVDVASTVALTT